MLDLFSSIKAIRLAVVLVISIGLLASSGCDVPGLKRKVTVPPLLGPLAEADTGELLAAINRTAALRSIRGKVDIQFLDTSFAECGVAEKYRTADGTVTLQRPGQIYLVIQTPFVNYSVAEMTSDGEGFRVAVLMGDEKYRRFVRGTNSAVYPKLESKGEQADCGSDEKKKRVTQQQAVSALSGLRPQHFTDALLLLPAAEAGSNLVYARSEQFEEEADTRPRAKESARVVRGYYVLDELAPEGEGRARLVRRFWFDRFEKIKLAKLQTFDERGQLTTDVLYNDPKSFGEDGRYVLPSRIELTRPQDRYSLRINYQAPEAVVVDRPYNAKTFVLDNKWQLQEVDLDARGASAKSQQKQ
ncbi:MAG: hypothetical protein H0T92_21340 [Pyrinomonadaceae bacterium]|nr:hypothetical protein [Pyrinomonadaceae bacterium]